ncbi:acyltransferase family protein [Bradyrhizobium sp. CCGUVB1N3]|uniref:acyltransferase family protein n=1 Tax=Bradyrhizobium sp. CCGUVB1N3 TaxID=2949629 RepID=UPI0020B2EA1F|nr:acyltransferase family protein [Bradyrhizobium sp. CCGUVB1N3]MCP3472959.1 acyltransferase family protein [Bradyrhizobium sp. CCGUVB1N3]
MADIASGATAESVTGGPRAPRLLFIDNIRWSMILLVLSMHAADTYSPFGNWYYVDRQATGFGTALFFGIYQSFLQAFFMAVLFFIAGYFAAASCDRKGFATFARDRLVRLGVPTLLYMFAIGPLTQYFLSRTWGRGGFGHQWLTHLGDGEWLSETGPMWFCAVLLLFSLAYGLIRLSGRRERTVVLRWPMVVAFVMVMAGATVAVRIVVQAGTSVLNVHPGDLPQYLLMFAAGAYGYRGNWMAGLAERSCLRWGALALTLSVPLFAALVLFGGGLEGETALYSGGFISSVPGSACGRRWSAWAWASSCWPSIAVISTCRDRSPNGSLTMRSVST